MCPLRLRHIWTLPRSSLASTQSGGEGGGEEECGDDADDLAGRPSPRASLWGEGELWRGSAQVPVLLALGRTLATRIRTDDRHLTELVTLNQSGY